MATKKPTPAQLKARKLFAQRSKAGTLQRSKKQNLAIAMSEQRAGHPRKAREFFRAAAISPEMVGSMGKAKRKPAVKRSRNPIANEIAKASRGSQVEFPYRIQVANNQDFNPARTVAGFVILGEAKSYAEALNASFPGLWIRVEKD
jgi:hypothetical protein